MRNVQVRSAITDARGLFDRLPATLFQPLAAPSRRVYAAVLLRLYELAQAMATVEEEAAVEAIVDVVAAAGQAECDLLVEETQEELQTLAGEPQEADLQDSYRRQRLQARAILRRLEAAGWLAREVQRDYSRHYTLPAYTFPLLEAFHQVVERRATEFEGLIYDTYLLLNRPDSRMSGYVLLQQAHEQTSRIVAGLKQLQHNIGSYIEQIVANLEVREVLASFGAYRVQVAPNYHRLKTADNVARYRLDIEQAISRYERDATWIAQATQEAQRRHPGLTPAEAERQIWAQLAYIRHQFGQMSETMALIDERHSRYAEAAVAQVRYRVSGGLDLPGRLVELCRLLGSISGRGGERAPDALTQLFRLFAVDFVGPRSLRTPTQVRRAYQPPALIDLPDDPLALQAMLAAVEEEIRSTIRPEDAWAHLAAHLDGRDVVESCELPLETLHDWLLLISLLLYADLPESQYRCLAPPAECRWLERGPFRCPNLRFARNQRQTKVLETLAFSTRSDHVG